jgi:transposase
MAPPPSHSQSVLPNSQCLVLDSIHRDEKGFLIDVSTRQTPRCPDCGARSRSFHSHYERFLQDLPWQGLSVRLRLKARRFRCRNLACQQKVFVERLPHITRAYGRQTDRLKEIVRSVGFVAGGLPGSRLLARLAITVSDDTVLRFVKLLPVAGSQEDPVGCLGVDDWAWRKGQEYGTILVDLDRHAVVDLLPDRSAEGLAEWLAKHPTVNVISRDRSGAYADGAHTGAPGAQQVADRFHLFLNLSAAIERALEERSRQLQIPPQEANGEQAMEDVQPKLTQQQTLTQEHRQRRLELYEKVIQLHHQGNSQRAIGQALQIQRKTVRRWLRAGEFPERKVAVRKPSKVHEFTDYLQRRWAEGCHNATALFQKIRTQGYGGQRSMVAQFVSGWRAGKRSRPPVHPRRISPKQAAVLITRAPDRLSNQQRLLFDQLSSTCPELIWMRSLALDFRAALISKEDLRMRNWIQTAKQSGIGSFVRFAFGLQRDMSAVLAAVETPWSNGQVEGQVNRLKMIKRQMYGRAGFRLLLARVLPYRPIANSVLRRAP